MGPERELWGLTPGVFHYGIWMWDLHTPKSKPLGANKIIKIMTLMSHLKKKKGGHQIAKVKS